MNEQHASDLYLTVGYPPAMRLDRGVVPIHQEPLTLEELNEILASILTSRQRRDFDTNLELNMSLDAKEYGRYRVSALRQRQAPAVVLRRIISKIPSFNALRLPRLLEGLACEKRGLILVTGMTGAGKSTTLASMINHRNAEESGHIITIEDPIEYFHEHQRSIITQREVGIDTESYDIALKNALRQRPDVILVGEIRERIVMESVMSASETGHLCLSTMHTNNAYQSIDRIINMFPEDYHDQVRAHLAMNLKAIISQRLIPAKDGRLTLALEIMLNKGLVRDLIAKGDIRKIRDVMARNLQQGMCTFDQSIFNLYAEGVIEESVAISNAEVPGDLQIKINQHKLGEVDQGSGFREVDTSLLSISKS